MGEFSTERKDGVVVGWEGVVFQIENGVVYMSVKGMGVDTNLRHGIRSYFMYAMVFTNHGTSAALCIL
jgi:hypothetical protein